MTMARISLVRVAHADGGGEAGIVRTADPAFGNEALELAAAHVRAVTGRAVIRIEIGDAALGKVFALRRGGERERQDCQPQQEQARTATDRDKAGG
jgi:hypothetical protein